MENHRKIRLSLVSSVFVDRGAERIILYLFNKLPKDEFDIDLVCLRDLAPYAEVLYEQGGPNVKIIGMKNNFDIISLYKLYNYFKISKPDIVHFHSYRAAIWGLPISKIARVPISIYSVHNKWGGKFHHLFERWSSNFSDAIIPFSCAVKKYLIEEIKINKKYITETIYIGIDIDKYKRPDERELAKLKRELNLNRNSKVIGFVGALEKQKGLPYLFLAIQELTKKNNLNIKCLLIGDGAEKDNLLTLVKELNIKSNVIFLGQRYDVPKLLNLMDIFILPSLWEGLPQVVLEAMAARCPVIATKVNGTPEIITNQVDGVLIPPKSVKTLMNSILKVLNDDDFRNNLIHNGYLRVSSSFSAKSMIDNFYSFYYKKLREKHLI